MDQSFYAEQFKGAKLSGVIENRLDASLIERATEELKQAIEVYNFKVEQGILQNVAPAKPYATLWSTTRKIRRQVAEILDAAGFKRCWDPQEQFPGLVSISTETKLAHVYLTERDYVQDRTQPMKIGRYLRRTGLYTDDQVNNIANRIKSAIYAISSAELYFAKTGDEIVHVYVNGPHSCMGGRQDFGWLPHHPVYVYGTPDIHCAHVILGDRIVARVLTNEIEKTYSTIYGNEFLMEKLLDKAGYTPGDLDGCRVLAIETDDGGYLMPYIDGSDYVGGEHDGFLTIGEGSEYCNTTTGTTREGHHCDYCDDFIGEDEGYWIDGADAHVCSLDCADSMGYTYLDGEFVDSSEVVYCQTSDEYYRYDSDDIVSLDGEYYPVDDDAIVYSDDQGEYIFRDNAVYIDDIDSWVDDDREHEFAEEEDDEDIYEVA